MQFTAQAIASSVFAQAIPSGAPEVDPDRTMAGVWSTPLPMFFTADAGQDALRFTSEQGGFQVILQKDRRTRVTLSAGGAPVSGNANFDFTHIHWDNGAVWSKESQRTASRSLEGNPGESEAAVEQPHLFSDRQADVIIDQINLAVDIPLLGESTERKIIAGLINQLNPLMKPALATCMPPELAGTIGVMLDETKNRQEKHDLVRLVLKSMIKQPLVTHLHTQIDTKIPDELELKVLKKAVGVMIRQMVEQMVIGLEKSGFVSCQ